MSPENSPPFEQRFELLFVTCSYRRVEITRESISSLLRAIDLCGVESTLIIVVDDTRDHLNTRELASMAPRVLFLEGTGDLFWGGAMELAERFIKSRLLADTVVFFNDDVVFNAESLARFVRRFKKLQQDVPKFVLGGATIDDRGIVSYGGWNQVKGITLDFVQCEYVAQTNELSRVQECTVVNFNFVALPFDLFYSMAIFRPQFKHKGADFDFCLRASKFGTRILCFLEPIGICSRNTEVGTHRDSRLTTTTRLRLFFKPKGGAHSLFAFYRAHAGPFWWIRICFALIANMLGRLTE